MRRKPRVLLDVDGVLADFVGAWIDVVEDLVGVRISRDHVDDWDFFGSLKKMGHLEFEGLGTIEDLERVVWERTHSQHFCRDLKILEGAMEAVTTLKEISDLYVVTSPANSDYWMAERTKWCWENFGIPFKRVGHVHFKQFVSGDFLIDDKFENVRGWVEEQDGLGILFSSPINDRPEFRNPQRICSETRRILRTSDWAEILETVRSFRHKRVGG